MQQPSEGGATGIDLASDAKQLGNSAANRIHSEVDSRKSDAADQVRSVSTAIQNTAGSLEPNAPSWLKSAFQQSAQQVQRFADALDHKDSRQLMNEVQDFARQRPALFLGACAAAGFAAARILKAGGEQGAGPSSSGSRGQQIGGGQSLGERFGSTQQVGGATEASVQRASDEQQSRGTSNAPSASGPSSGEFAQ